MNKKVRLTSLTAAALASVVLAGANVNSNVVKAETKPENASAKAQTPEDAAKANVASAQKNVDTEQGNVNKAQGELDQAKKDAEKPDADYKAQSSKVDGLKKTADQKNSELTTAKDKTKNAKALAEEATDPEKVKAAGDAVTKQKGVVDADNEAKKAADKAVTAKQKEIKGLEGQVETAQTNVDKKTNAKKQADQKVQAAEDALKGTGVAEATSNKDKAQSEVVKLNKQLEGKNKEIESLNSKKTNIDNQLSEQQSKQSQATKDLKTAQEASKEAKDKAKPYDDKVAAKQKEISKLEDSLKELERQEKNSKNTINVVDADKYKQAYVDWKQHKKLTPDDIAFLKDALAKNKYISSDEDKKVSVDPNNLTSSQLKEISVFAANIINKVKDQFGWKHVVVTPGAVNFAGDVAKGYEDDLRNGQYKSNWHDAKRVNELAKSNKLKYDKDNPTENQPYENLSVQKQSAYSDSGQDIDIHNMDQLKEHVYVGLLHMIIPDGKGRTEAGGKETYEFGHAEDLLDIPLKILHSEKEQENAKQRFETEISHHGKIAESAYKQYQQFKDLANTIEKRIEYYSSIGDKDRAEEAKTDYQNYLKAANGHYKSYQNFNKNKNHAQELLDTYEGNLTKYFGTSINVKVQETTNHAFKENYSFIHFINVKPSQILDQKSFDTTSIPLSNDEIEKVNKQIQSKKDNLSKLQTEAKPFDELVKTKAKQEKDAETKKKQIAGVVEKLQGQETELNTQIQSKSEKTQALESKLSQAKIDLQNAETKLKKLTSSHSEKTDLYNKAVESQKKAETELSSANEELDKVQTKLSQANKVLSNLQTKAKEKNDIVQTAQKQLSQLENHVKELQNAATNLATAQQAEKDAQTAYDTAKKNADDGEKVLNDDLKTNKDKADAKVKDAQTAYDNAVAKLNDAKSKLADAQQALQNILDAQQTPYIPEGLAQDLAPQEITGDVAQPISTSEPTQSTPTQTQDISAESTETTKTAETKKSQAPSYKIVTLTHNAIVYNKHGKALKHGLHVKIIKRGKSVKALKHGKIVTIKGKQYYQIGNNEFIKVANTKKHAIHIKARIKGSKKIRTYNKHGKFNKHYARAHHTYTFNKKAKINGKTYYKIAGTNNWIPAKKLALKK